MTNSKELFTELVNRIRLDSSRDEIHSIIYLLLAHKFGLSKIDIMSRKEIESVEMNEFTEMIQRINREEPIQYILGKSEFYGRSFMVSRSVLIPRPETELMVRSVIKESVGTPTILDIGTGSGCIAITLALEIPGSQIYGIDISEDALSVARQNSEDLSSHVEFSRVDILGDTTIDQRFDIIVSNPPYIADTEKQEMKANVLEYEPHLALFVPNDDPIVFYRAIAKRGKSLLKPGGKVYLEINEKFGQEIVIVFKKEGYEAIVIEKDFDGKDRFFKATK